MWLEQLQDTTRLQSRCKLIHADIGFFPGGKVLDAHLTLRPLVRRDQHQASCIDPLCLLHTQTRDQSSSLRYSTP